MIAEVKPLRFAVVCRHNMNRSVSVHRMMKMVGLNVRSYGTEDVISLPGRTKCSSVKVSFQMTYEDVKSHLVNIDHDFYREIKVLEMLENNINTKDRPERFQESDLDFDVIMTLDSASEQEVLRELNERLGNNEDFQHRNSRVIQLVHMSVEDELSNIKDASHHAAVLAQMLQECKGDWEEVESVVWRFNEVSEPDGYIAKHSVFRL